MDIHMLQGEIVPVQLYSLSKRFHQIKPAGTTGSYSCFRVTLYKALLSYDHLVHVFTSHSYRPHPKDRGRHCLSVYTPIQPNRGGGGDVYPNPAQLDGVPLSSPIGGVPPSMDWWGVIASTCYMVGGTPLAFRQEDFLVSWHDATHSKQIMTTYL